MSRLLETLPNNEDEFGWSYKVAARCFGTIASITCIINGIVTIITPNPVCIAMGVYMVVLGIGLFLFEAPFICKQVDRARQLHDFISNRRFIEKAAIYILLSLIPIFVCFGVTTMIGCGVVFLTGVAYAMMAIGKRGGALEKQQQQQQQQEMGLLTDEEKQKQMSAKK